MSEAVIQPRSKRGQIRHKEQELTPLQQIPVLPGGINGSATGAWAYYIRPEGATIAEALILYPNGGEPDLDDARQAARFATNSEYYQARQAAKGFEYIGQTLTEDGVRRLVEVLEDNREDEILYCEDEIENARRIADNSDRPDTRDRERKRASQLERRLGYLTQPLDPDALIAELNDIARAQALAKVDPQILRVMRAMVGEVNEKLADAITHFQTGRVDLTGESSVRIKRQRGNESESDLLQ